MRAFVLAAALGVAIDAAAQGSVAGDRAALAALHDATGGADWTHRTNWTSDEPLDAWHGVTTGAGGRVAELSLPENGLAGTLPARLGNLTRLRRLDLGGNRLDGSIPAELGDLVEIEELSLWNDDDLLDPDDGGLTGAIPAELGNLANLERLDLRENDLTDPIPAALGELTNLRELHLGRNELTGAIPAELGNLTRLRRLDLGRNRLSGPIPASLGRLTRLDELVLGGNDLALGPVPAWVGGLGRLSALSLSRANVTGPIPLWLGDLADLRRVDLSYNWGLSGPLPPGLNLSHLEELDIYATRACAPATWLSWMEAIDFAGAVCGSRPGVIDVAVFHTPAARESAGGLDEIGAEIDLYVAEANQALEESGVRARVALVASEEVDYTEAGEYDIDIERLADPSDGHLDGVHAVRDRVGADLVHLIVGDLDVCGVAQLGGPVGITLHGCGGRTLAHELGHNLGLHHDRYELAHLARRALSLHPGYGYVNQRGLDAGSTRDDRWLTVMAYWSQCNALSVRCTSLLRFSNPRQVWLGDPMGVPAVVDSMGDDGPADAVAVLDATVPVVAGFRRNPANRAPAPVGRLPNRTLQMDRGMEIVDVAEAFHDPDGDALIHATASSAPAVARARADGSRVTLTPVAPGSASITVTATDAAGPDGSAAQRFVVTVLSSATAFTDHPLRPGVTPVRAVHLLELRARTDRVREGLGLPAFGWTDPVLAPGSTPVRRVHLMELRAALDRAYRAAGRPPPRYTDPAVRAGATVIAAVHVMELRAAVVALEQAARGPRPGGRHDGPAPAALHRPRDAASRVRAVAARFSTASRRQRCARPSLRPDLNKLHAEGDRVAADLVHLVVGDLDVCGGAMLGGPFGITHGGGGRTVAQ